MSMVMCMVKKGKYSHLIPVKKLSVAVMTYRIEHNLSREEFGALTGICDRYIADIENCEKRCTIDFAFRIIKFLKIDAKEIFPVDYEEE